MSQPSGEGKQPSEYKGFGSGKVNQAFFKRSMSWGRSRTADGKAQANLNFNRSLSWGRNWLLGERACGSFSPGHTSSTISADMEIPMNQAPENMFASRDSLFQSMGSVSSDNSEPEGAILDIPTTENQSNQDQVVLQNCVDQSEMPKPAARLSSRPSFRNKASAMEHLKQMRMQEEFYENAMANCALERQLLEQSQKTQAMKAQYQGFVSGPPGMVAPPMSANGSITPIQNVAPPVQVSNSNCGPFVKQSWARSSTASRAFTPISQQPQVATIQNMEQMYPMEMTSEDGEPIYNHNNMNQSQNQNQNQNRFHILMPNDFVRNPDGKKCEFRDLSKEDFIIATCKIIQKGYIAPIEKEYRLEHMRQLMALSKQHHWAGVRNMYENYLMEIQMGARTWDSPLGELTGNGGIKRLCYSCVSYCLAGFFCC